MTRCPFNLSRLVNVTDTGQVIYKAEKPSCRAFPAPDADGIAAGPKRNFQIFSPPDFLAEFTQHIPPTGWHRIGYFGWYSNKTRGMRSKGAAEPSAEPIAHGGGARAATGRCSPTWAMLIKRVYEIDPMACPGCGTGMKVVAFIEPLRTTLASPNSRCLHSVLSGITFPLSDECRMSFLPLHSLRPFAGHPKPCT